LCCCVSYTYRGIECHGTVKSLSALLGELQILLSSDSGFRITENSSDSSEFCQIIQIDVYIGYLQRWCNSSTVTLPVVPDVQPPTSAINYPKGRQSARLPLLQTWVDSLLNALVERTSASAPLRRYLPASFSCHALLCSRHASLPGISSQCVPAPRGLSAQTRRPAAPHDQSRSCVRLGCAARIHKDACQSANRNASEG
jgi:hypothetical protein